MRIQSEILRCSELSLYKTSEMDLISRKYRKSKSRGEACYYYRFIKRLQKTYILSILYFLSGCKIYFECYKNAIVKNMPNVKAMEDAVMAMDSSTDSKPNHARCPKGKQSWCFYSKKY